MSSGPGLASRSHPRGSVHLGELPPLAELSLHICKMGLIMSAVPREKCGEIMCILLSSEPATLDTYERAAAVMTGHCVQGTVLSMDLT